MSVPLFAVQILKVGIVVGAGLHITDTCFLVQQEWYLHNDDRVMQKMLHCLGYLNSL
jgi:hypothetical protein